MDEREDQTIQVADIFGDSLEVWLGGDGSSMLTILPTGFDARRADVALTREQTATLAAFLAGRSNA